MPPCPNQGSLDIMFIVNRTALNELLDTHLYCHSCCDSIGAVAVVVVLLEAVGLAEPDETIDGAELIREAATDG